MPWILVLAYSSNNDCKMKEGFLIPIIKGWSTELAQEVTSNGVQIHGGMGFIEETGAAQYMRDARILPIYEGTNAIQANDFMFRKTLRDNGITAQSFIKDMNSECADNNEMIEAINLASETLNFILENRDDQEMLSCVSFDYLMGFGYLVGGWLMHKANLKAQEKLSTNQKDNSFLKGKILSSEFYDLHILPRIQTHFKIVLKGANVIKFSNDTLI